jgi:glycosyltransferase involved in cell wall biosynthesis
VIHIPNGVDCRRFSRHRRQPTAPPPETPGQNAPIVIGTVAELRPEKNLSRLLHVFSRVRDVFPARLIIAGDGPDRRELENLVSKLGLGSDVDFVGHVMRPETVLGKLDIYAITSNTEQMPLSVLEAMAHGLPVLGVDTGDVKSMVAPANRPFIVPPAQESLAAALTDLMKSPEQRARIGGENEWWARLQHDQSIMFRRYEALWLEVLAATSARKSACRRLRDLVTSNFRIKAAAGN